MPYLESDRCTAAKDTGQTLESILEFLSNSETNFA